METTARFARASAGGTRLEAVGASARSVVSSTDVFGIFEGGDISKLDVSVFESNPVVLWDLDAGALPVGRATSIEFMDSIKTADGKTTSGWVMDFDWFDGAFAREVARAWDGGFLGATSIGVKWDSKMVEDADGGLTFEPVQGSQQLREVSVVPVPMDTGAVKLARASLSADFIEKLGVRASAPARKRKLGLGLAARLRLAGLKARGC